MRKDQSRFYHRLVKTLIESEIPFTVGGAFALRAHTGIRRETKDLDVFCRPGDFHRMMNHLNEAGFNTEVIDHRWLGKAFLTDAEGYYADIIFATASGAFRVSDEWVDNARTAQFFGFDVKVLAPEELLLSKVYVQDRERYDGADVNHVILKTGRHLDWPRLLNQLDHHWELFFSVLLNFIFVYPSEREIVPTWLLEELASRVKHASELSYKPDRITRGHLLSRKQYKVDARWGYKTIT
jgi:hypothetical protein